MQLRRFALLPALLLVLSHSTFSHAQTYNSIVVFGDSLSDSGNNAKLTETKYGIRVPGPVADYTDGRFTDGIDTFPFALNYQGVWVEQLAAMLPSSPTIKNSLDGGTDYAYGFATTAGGTAVWSFGPSNFYSVNVENIGQQITDYLATHPKINNNTLFIVWGGAIDVLNARSSADVVNAAVRQAANVERLIAAGANQIVVPNLPPLGAVPRLNGFPATSISVTGASILYNNTLAAGLGIVHDANPGKHLRLFPLDVFSLFTTIIASPSTFGLVNVTSISQGVYPLNPDTYLFWDDLHPTTRGHNIIAAAADDLLVHHLCLADSAPNEHGEAGEADCKYIPAGVGGGQSQ